MRDSNLILGIDGGGSKTLALLATNEGRVLGRGSAASSNYHTVGAPAAFAALEQAIHTAFLDAQLPLSPVAAICMGLAGVDRPEDRQLFIPWASDSFPGASITIRNDAELVLAAGTPNGWGIGVICGTGSIVIGRDPDGNRTRADGWGFLLGDWGSGYSIGLAALRAVMAAHDGRGAQTQLSALALRHCNVSSPPGLLQWVYRERVPTSEIAALSQEVTIAAAEGDEVAQSIIRQAGEQLAHSVRAVANKLEFSGSIPCALAGGVITHERVVADAFRRAAINVTLHLEPITLVLEPALGAIRLAQQAL